MRIMGRIPGMVYTLVLLAIGFGVGLAISSRLGVMNDCIAQDSAVAATRIETHPGLVGMSDGLADIAEAVIPSVVNISTSKTIRQEVPASPFFSDPFFRKFFGEPETGPREFRQRSLGSGVIVSQDGYIVTNNHVVEGADEIVVALSDKMEYKGKVVGTDPRSDVAVIKIEAEGLPAALWGDSDKLRPGELVMAVGSPFGLSKTVTVGIISATGRANVGITDYEDFIQTDAAINPGNSGGALVNMKGELVGINTAIFSKTGGYQGIGFAVPSTMARQVMDSLINSGKVVRGWLGVSVQDLTPELARQFGVEEVVGALVADVVAGSPAEKAGLKQGDVIVGFEGRDVSDSGHLRNMVAATTVGGKVDVDVVRDNKRLSLAVVIGELPKEASGGPASEKALTDSVLSGVSVQPLAPELRQKLGIGKDVEGVVVTSVDHGSEAEDAGLMAGDVIVSINREPVVDMDGYNRLAYGLGVDQTVLLLINRKGSMLWMSIAPKG